MRTTRTNSTSTALMDTASKTRVTATIPDCSSDDDVDIFEPSSIFVSSSHQRVHYHHQVGGGSNNNNKNNNDEGEESSLLQSPPPIAASQLRLGGPDAFVGRQEPLNQLQKAFWACHYNQHAGQVVWLTGRSGSGKTSLVRHHFQTPIQQQECFFLAGKFDYNISRPLQVWRNVLTQLCDILLQNGTLLQTVQTCLLPPPTNENDKDDDDDDDNRSHGDWSEEIERLAILCPRMKILINDNDDDHNDDDDDDEQKEKNHNDNVDAAADDADRTTHSNASRLSSSHALLLGPDTQVALATALRKLLRHISIHIRPVVIFLDDMQWSDKTSLTLVQNLTCKREGMGRLLFLLAARNEEEEWTLPLQTLKTDLETIAAATEKNEAFLHLSNIEVGNLSLEDIGAVISHCLSCSTDSAPVQALARVVLRKTQGNAFFVQEFLKLLVDEGRLRFNPLVYRWEWDAAEIETNVQVSSNVCELMLKQLQRNLSTVQEETIFTAALLGFRFSRHLLNTALDTLGASGSLQALVEKGLVEEVAANGSYCTFVHDKVREAAKQLHPIDKVAHTSHEVGMKLLKKLKPDELEQEIFTVLSLLSSDLLMQQEIATRDKIARLYFSAGQKALGLQAFSLAETCLQQAVNLFSEHVWETDYSLAVDLYSLLIESQYILCDGLEAMQSTYDTLCRHATRDHRDRFRGTLTYLRQTHVSCSYDTVRTKSIEALAGYDCRLPERLWLVRTVVGLKRLVNKLCSMREEEISMLPQATPAFHEIQELLIGPLFHALYQLESKLMPLTSLRSVNLTLRHGLTDSSAIGLAQVALFTLVGLGDFAKAQCIVKQAISISNTRQLPSRVLTPMKYIVYAQIWHWRRPMKESMVALVENYRQGRKYGAIQYGMGSILMYSVMAFASGRPLEALSKDVLVYMRQAEDAGNVALLGMLKVLLQVVLNLMGQSTYTSELRGDILDPTGDGFCVGKAHSNVQNFFRLHESILSVFFGDVERAYHNAETNEEIWKRHPGMVGGKQQVFYNGLICFLKAEESNTKKPYVKQGQKYLKILRQWVKKGDPNLVHRLRFLEAEWAVVRGRREEAIRLYRDAIRLVSRLGFNNDHALFRERFGVYLLTNDIDEGSAYHYLINAHALYLEWGATAKAARMIQDYPELPEKQKQSRDIRSKFQSGSMDLI